MTDNFAARLAQVKLATKADVADYVKDTDFDNKPKKYIKSYFKLKKFILIKNEVKEEHEEIKKLQTFDSNLLIGQSYFGNDGSQNFLITQQISKSLTTFAGIPGTSTEWKSKGLQNEKIKSLFTANHSLPPKLVWINNSRIRVEFKGSCLKQGNYNFYSKQCNKFIFCLSIRSMVTRFKR